jgi:hypothetical protein
MTWRSCKTKRSGHFSDHRWRLKSPPREQCALSIRFVGPIIGTLGVISILAITLPASAEEMPADNSSDTHTTAAPDETHPIYSADANWTGAAVATVAGLFLAALVIGPIVRAEAPQAVPPAISHEEDPAADRH